MGAVNLGQQMIEWVIPFLGRCFERTVLAPDKLLAAPPLKDPPKHPDPVVFVAGLADTYYGGHDVATALRRDGFTKVYCPNLPDAGFSGIRESASYLARYVENVQRITGAKKVDLVTHSQGGPVARYYLEFLGGAQHVAAAALICSPNHGVPDSPVHGFIGPYGYNLIAKIPFVGALIDSWVPQGGWELFQGSAMLRKLNAAPHDPGNVRITNIYSASFDGNVIPQSAHLSGVKNVPISRGTHFFGHRPGPSHIAAIHSSVATYEAVRGALLAADRAEHAHDRTQRRGET